MRSRQPLPAEDDRKATSTMSPEDRLLHTSLLPRPAVDQNLFPYLSGAASFSLSSTLVNDVLLPLTDQWLLLVALLLVTTAMTIVVRGLLKRAFDSCGVEPRAVNFLFLLLDIVPWTTGLAAMVLLTKLAGQLLGMQPSHLAVGLILLALEALMVLGFVGSNLFSSFAARPR